jgi:hypothetical protein
MGALVGGESKFGSTEDEGIGGDSVEGGLDMMIEVQNTATCLRVVNHDYGRTQILSKSAQSALVLKASCCKLPFVRPHLII